MFLFCHSRVRDTTLALRAQIHWLSFVSRRSAASLFRSGASASKAFVGAEAAHTPQRTVTPSRPCPPPPLSSPSARPSASASRRCVLGPRPVPRAPRRSALSTRGSTRRAAVRARAHSDRRLLFPITHETPTLQPKRSTACRAAAKETSVKAEDFKCPLACDASKEADGAVVEMAKAKCVHPERPVAKACKDCPRK